LDALASRISELYSQPAEQFIDGLMDLARENFMESAKVSPEDRETSRASRVPGSAKQMVYWQACYPFPFHKQIKTWSQDR